MGTTLISGAREIQLIALAVIVIMAIIVGARIAGHGPKGFASGLMEVVSILIGLWIVVRPNDVLSMLLRLVGGIQTPTMPS